MTFIADFHIHSRFSRATSRDLCFEQLYAWGMRKGLSLIGSGDCTHPGWMAEIKEKLVEAGDGIFRLRDDMLPDLELPMGSQQQVRFLLTGEISTIYKADGATRKVHHLICLPDLESVERLNARLTRIGNITSDGRPILGLDSRDLLEILLESSPQAVLIPAHIWTPWFSVLGSKSGFDAVEDCYRDLAEHIFAVETGLSSDPSMNWRVSKLDRYTLISNSDAHSAAKLGREANIFQCEMGYAAVMRALRRQDADGFQGTIEFFPEEGKYHADGHRKCHAIFSAQESRALRGRCPVCGNALTLGVQYRVAELADRPLGRTPDSAVPYQRLLPLCEIIGEMLLTSASSKKVAHVYQQLLAQVGPELYILREADFEEIKAVGGELLARAIEKMRAGQVHATPGYDGEYGAIKIFNDIERAEVLGQIKLFEGSFATVKKSPGLPPPALLEMCLTPSPVIDIVEESEEQQCAIRHPAAPLLIVAGPGAGKTHTLVERMKWLIQQQQAPPTSLLALTFSNRAARELAERTRQALGRSSDCPTVTTFHKLGYQLIAAHAEELALSLPLRILAEEEAEELFAQCQDTGAISKLDDWEKALADLFTGATPEMLPRLLEEAQTLAPSYVEKKRAAGVLDFTDLLLLPLALLSAHEDICAAYRQRWQHVLVDEYQDVNVFQYLLLRLLCPENSDLCVIGDADQAIYGFRGADVRYFLRFQQDYPQATQLELSRNFRSCQTIVAASTQVIAPQSRVATLARWSSISGPEQLEVVSAASPQAEAEFVVQTIESLLGGISHFSLDSGRGGDGVGRNLGFNDIAVLYRTHALGEEIQQALERSGIPYQRALRRDVFQRADVRRVLAILALAQHPTDWSSAGTLLTLGFPGCPAAVGKSLLARRPARESSLKVLDFLQQHGCDIKALSATITMLKQPITPVRAILQVCILLGIPEATLEETAWLVVLRHAQRTETIATFLESTRLERDIDIYDPRAARVALMTVHAAKGLEWKTVFMLGCEDGSFPHAMSPEEEERRLFYVGMTRARQQLYLCHSSSRLRQGERLQRRPSPFIEDISAELKHQQNPGEGRAKRPRDRQLAMRDLF